MPSKSKAKGNRIERHIVETLQDAGWEAKRAWGSNGQALGKHEEVDIVSKWKNKEFDIQVKGRKNIAEYMIPPESCHMTIAKADRSEPLVVMRLQDFIHLLDNVSQDHNKDATAE